MKNIIKNNENFTSNEKEKNSLKQQINKEFHNIPLLFALPLILVVSIASGIINLGKSFGLFKDLDIKLNIFS